MQKICLSCGVSYTTPRKSSTVCSSACRQKQYCSTHGNRPAGTPSKAYVSWTMMKVRCDNKNYHAYPKYGGAGITYDPSWAVFENFHTDMGDPPEGYTLDRIDGSLVYSKATCRWATKRGQTLNRAKTVTVLYRGEERYLVDLITEANMSATTVRDRLKRGWSLEDALHTPPKPNTFKGGK